MTVKRYSGTGFIDSAAQRWNVTSWIPSDTVYASDSFCSKTWLNRTNGIGARNGANSHTIGGAKSSVGCTLGFTPTVGSLLVLVVAGAATNTSSGTEAGDGWVERVSPVNSCELSVFTKTAVGNDFLTVTHNASNYSINWAAYELPSGSTYTNSAGVTGSNDSFPVLSGLPGTSQFVLAAYCRGFLPGATITGGCTVVSPWIEDSDSIASGAPNDNNYLYVFHRAGVTTTTVDPSFTFGVNGTMHVDRQKVVAAFTLA